MVKPRRDRLGDDADGLHGDANDQFEENKERENWGRILNESRKIKNRLNRP